MITNKQLVEFLKEYPENAEVKWNTGQEIKNIACQQDGTIILSDHRAIAYCLKCGSNIYKEKEIPDYLGYCPTCDENKYEFETEPKTKE